MGATQHRRLPSGAGGPRQSLVDYDTRYPGIDDLKRLAKRRVPNFAFDYMEAGIDREMGKRRNRDAFDAVRLWPRYLRDVSATEIEVTTFGRRYAMPLGVAPVGLGNMMWPQAERSLAAAAQQANIPYVLSTFSTTDLAEIAQAAPDVCWFQLYTPQQPAALKDLLARVQAAGFHVLVVTVDIPVGAKRNRELKNGLKLPFSFTWNIVWQSMTHPRWALTTLRHGRPDFVNVQRYRSGSTTGLAEFITNFSAQGVSREHLRTIRRIWQGPLVVKGVQHPQDALDALNLGADGLILSNHGGRQLDGAPSSLESLRRLPDEVHRRMTVMLDSGVRTGLDVIRAKALGAQMVFSGRSFFYGVAALGVKGGRQVAGIYRDEITRTLKQLGCASFEAMDGSWLAGA